MQRAQIGVLAKFPVGRGDRLAPLRLPFLKPIIEEEAPLQLRAGPVGFPRAHAQHVLRADPLPAAVGGDALPARVVEREQFVEAGTADGDQLGDVGVDIVRKEIQERRGEAGRVFLQTAGADNQRLDRLHRAEIRRADQDHRRDAVGPLRVLAEKSPGHEAAHAVAHQDEFRLPRGNTRFFLVDAGVTVQGLPQQRRRDRGDFLPPVIDEGEEVGPLRVGMKTGRVLLFGHTRDELAVNVDRPRRDHRPGLQRIGQAQGEIEVRIANRIDASPDARRVVTRLFQIEIVEPRSLVGGQEHQHLDVKRTLGPQMRGEEKQQRQRQGEKKMVEPELHATCAALDPGTGVVLLK